MKGKLGSLYQVFKGAILLLLVTAWAWAIAALFFSGPGPEWARIPFACFFGALLPTAFFLSRSFYKGLLLCLALFAAHITWWQTLQPTNDKDWAAEVARISHGVIEGNQLTMHNVRNFSYVGDEILVERWETRNYDLSKLQGLDLFLSYWASDHIAHTILSWDFGDDQHLAISIETRKDTTQEYSALKGFFKQFEISYVAADEKDIIRLRTNFRKERVYVYQLKVSRERARALLENYLAEMNRLVEEPEFYNALTRNCTTTIHIHTNATAPGAPTPMDWRLIASGHLDELLYERGILVEALPFGELREQSRIDQKMQLSGGEHFSSILRHQLPKPEELK
jgi:hypothetical protein